MAEAKAVLAQNPGLAGSEIVVVNDGSSDRTGEILSSMDDIRYGRALKSGFTAAAHDTIVMIDADVTYPLTALPEMLNLYAKGFDMVVAERTGRKHGASLAKAPLRAVLRWLVEYTSGRKVPDINSGFRVLNKKTVTGYFSHLCDTFSFTTSMTLSYMMTGRFVGYCPIDYRERKGKTKVRLLRDSLRTLQYIAQATVYYNPLKIFILMAAIALMGAIAGFVLSFAFGILTGYILGIAGLVLSFLMFSVGLVAVLLKQIMDK